MKEISDKANKAEGELAAEGEIEEEDEDEDDEEDEGDKRLVSELLPLICVLWITKYGVPKCDSLKIVFFLENREDSFMKGLRFFGLLFPSTSTMDDFLIKLQHNWTLPSFAAMIAMIRAEVF